MSRRAGGRAVSLVATGPPLPARPEPAATAWRVCLALSALLHGGLGVMSLLSRVGSAFDLPQPPVTVEWVAQQQKLQGAPQPGPQPPAEPAPPSPAAPSSAADRPPPSPQPSPSSAPSSQPTPSQPTPPQPAPAQVNLGDSAEDVAPLTVTGDVVRPPTPDPRYRNLPPAYPPDAARARAEGVVQLLIHVGASGIAQAVDIAGSSGNASLDAAARRAVLRWHFTPASAGGRPVPADYQFSIRFSMSEGR